MRSQVFATILLGLCACSALGDSEPTAGPGPVEAEFLARVDVRHLESGKTIFARVTRDWNGPNCALRSGSILEGTIEVAEIRKGRSESKLALSFHRAQCNGADLTPMELLLAAVSGPPEDWENVPDAEFKMPVMFMQPNGMNGFGGASLGGFSLSHMELRGTIHHFPMTRNVEPGAVLEIRGMKLGLGTGPNRSSVLTTRNRDLSLEPFTQLLLVPSALVFVSVPQKSLVPNGANGANAISVPRPPPAPVNDLEVCAPPGCAVDLPAANADAQSGTSASLAIEPLGYRQRTRRVQDDFSNEEELAWLSPQQLLFTFNSHALIRREGTGSNATHRMIRALVLDAQTRTVKRAVDWEVADRGRYLWPLGNHRVLVHVGNELRIYKEGLEVVNSIPLTGPLSFVRITPNGKLMAIATLHERHSPELHAQLREQLGGEPEEDVEVSIVDESLKALAKASTVSGLQPPTLLNEGQVNLLSQPKMRYRLALTGWDNKSSTLARITSRCSPQLTSVAPDLLFLLSCNVATGHNEYRVLGADGKLLMRGEAGSFEIGHDVAGSPDLFAMKAVRALHEWAPGMQFKASDLESEELRVYRASDRKRVLTVRVQEPITSHGGYALSPDGSQLAVLSETQIQFFPLPAE